MLKRILHLIAVAAVATAITAPAATTAQAGGRNGGGYSDRDGSRHVARDFRHNKRGRNYRRAGHKSRYRASGHRRHIRYAPRPVIWFGVNRHRHRRHWRRGPHFNLAVLFSVLEGTRTGFTHRWHDPDTRMSGTVTPTRTFRLASGQYCREYQQRIVIDGRAQEGFGRACRRPDGSWKTVN
jgi:Ni/Co efflux regulator RcnB